MCRKGAERESWSLPGYFVTKHAGRNLSEYMINENFEIRKSLIPKILGAMLSIHSKGYVHNDVKPSNILINFNAENGVVSVTFCDFDQSYKVGEEITVCGFTAGI